MDGRAYDGVKAVSPTVFTAQQRQRLEAFTAVRALCQGWDSFDTLRAASWIADGRTGDD